MKQHLLSDGDRAALQALVPLAGALGVGTIFALFFGGRRKSGTAVFELFAIVAVLTAAGSTAFFSVSLLHQNEAITSHDLTQTATTLLVAAFLLVFVSVFARLPGAGLRLIALVPLALSGVVIVALLASTTWSTEPENASVAALVLLGVGALLGVCAWGFERLDIGWDRRWEHRRLTRLYAAGYLPDEKALTWFCRTVEKEPAWTLLVGCGRAGPTWTCRAGCGCAGRPVLAGGAFATGEAQPPVGSEILVRVKVGFRVPWLRDHAVVQVTILEPARGGEARTEEVRSNEDGLFDVTDLGLV